ncbi:hypothetical protein CROQUDRAFT_99803 [Cronartium quercuum f. sp. fusiforme G11]|uniref:Uncharacterized protein n=1 Tax=Cronartium quercuum f. sp. fusiforme G11 TaxID=708437 RepID=A0A9P6NB88_9BASI|nr:hypothetical protein CROQUDRAFT_99803 [Cronartium quercuum f. sp. fusiforme G11]
MKPPKSLEVTTFDRLLKTNSSISCLLDVQYVSDWEKPATENLPRRFLESNASADQPIGPSKKDPVKDFKKIFPKGNLVIVSDRILPLPPFAIERSESKLKTDPT